MIEEGKDYRYFHPMIDYRQFTFNAARVEPLLKKRLEKGERVVPRLPDSEQLKISRANMQTQLDSLDGSYKRLLNPHIYKVSISEKLKDLKMDFIKKNLK